ncbi:MAG TPA: hypothetical protein VFI24_20195 [Pyrinomonadaceae bacterium]|nr:hypothetical protein [Pyrinomonadaceae bacterium]
MSHNPLSDSPTRFTNPFVVESPEKLTTAQIVDLFVTQFTDIETVKQRKHTLIWGSRGAGKSMMLRYLEPQCQSLASGGINEFFGRGNSFFAVYCPCKEGQPNKTELLLLDNYSRLIISEHMMNLAIADRLVESFQRQFPANFFRKEDCVEFVKRTLRLFDRASIASSIEKVDSAVSLDDEPFTWLQELFIAENRKVSNYLTRNALRGGGAIYEGATSGYHDFLLPLMKLTQKLPGLNSASVYVLLDDAGKFTKEQQSIVNTWIANRDQSAICLKVTALREEYKTFLTRDGGLIEKPHDYSSIDIEELYTQSKEDYAQKVKLIANKRLGLSDVPTKDIETFLPPDSTEEALLDSFKRETAGEWEQQGQPGRQRDYVTRYATARLFQHLKASRQRKSYAGFQTIVHLSSGVVRDFLEPCYLMFDEYVSEGRSPDSISLIPPAFQNEVLFRYSEEHILGKFEDIRKNLPPEKWPQVDALKTLLESLGRLFYERLHDPEAREARLFSFTIRGSVPSSTAEVLDLGVRHRYFQLRTYSTKEGGGRESWYILNRWLCPAYKLDPTGFEGRISLTAKFIQLAMEDPDKFVKLRLKQQEDSSSEKRQATLFSLEEEEAG